LAEELAVKELESKQKALEAEYDDDEKLMKTEIDSMKQKQKGELKAFDKKQKELTKFKKELMEEDGVPEDQKNELIKKIEEQLEMKLNKKDE